MHENELLLLANVVRSFHIVLGAAKSFIKSAFSMLMKTFTEPAKIPRRGNHCVNGLPAGRPQLPKGKGPSEAQGHADLAAMARLT